MLTKRLLIVLCTVVLPLLLSIGCAGVHKQAFNREAHQELKVIGLLEPANNGEYQVHNLGHAGMGFGLIGGLVAAADMQSKTTRFTELMKARDFSIVAEFQSALAAELQNKGYTVKMIKPNRAKPDFMEKYDTLDKEVDAYLDLGVSGGYLCASGTADYIPTVRSGVRLIERASQDIIYQDVISYGYGLRAADAVSIAADQKYFFKNFDSLTGDPDLAVEGLRKGIPLVVQRIAQDLAK